MARIARVVIPGVPHHVTQRGNRKQQTFFSDRDYELYKKLMARWCQRYGVRIWAYCLMPNHSHLVAVPNDTSALARAVGEAHRRYTRTVNRRQGWTGYLWQGRFASFPMSDRYLLNAVRYVLHNPVRAGLTRTAIEWPHSSARAHQEGLADNLVDPRPLADYVLDWEVFLAPHNAEADCDLLRLHQGTGRPLGDDDFLSRLEAQTGRRLRSQKSASTLLQARKRRKD